MPENKEWPCEHIKYDSHRDEHYMTAESCDGNTHFFRNKWNFCPVCGTEKPKPQDEIELDEIFNKHHNYFMSGIDWREAIKKAILKWKRMGDAKEKETR